MKILVTGQSGYIGAVLVPMMKQAGHDVVGLDTDYFDLDTFGDLDTDFEATRGDIRRVEAADLHGFDAIVHLAALSNDPLGDIDEDLTFAINHSASVHLARLARSNGIQRFIYASSCSMYGSAGEYALDESAPLNPLTPYAMSKVRTETDLSRLANGDFSPVFMRNATVYGMSPRFRSDVVLNNLVGWAYTTGAIRILSDGTPWRPIVHVEDLARATLLLLTAPREQIHNQAFNVGSNVENYRVSEIAHAVSEVIPDCRVEYAEEGGPDPRSYRVDFGKLARLGFNPTWEVARGAEEVFDAIKKEALSFDDFNGRRCVRLKQLKHLLTTGQVTHDLYWRDTPRA